jgi:3-keto-5-aminohexanoate cleavage enzyme
MFGQSLIVNLAPTGAVADHIRNPHVPVTLDRIVEDVAAAARLGAAIAHLHVRNEDASPSCDPVRFGALLGALRAHSDCGGLLLCASTSGRHGQTPEERAAVLELPPAIRPDMASLTMGSLNFPGGASVNTPETIRYLARRMQAQGVKPELEIFDLGMIEFARTLIGEGLLTPPYYFNIILGNVGGLQASAQHLGYALSLLPDRSIACLGGIGRSQFQANALGMVAADGIRVGLEDNLWAGWSPKIPATNTGLLSASRRVATALGRAFATPAEVHERLRLPFL